ncbi:MAG: DEAD/DEAH box helicase [Thiotrichaceae bacterium]
MSFKQFDLHKELAASLDTAGYENPTLLQKQLIPLVNERKNIIVESQTAAGKTGGYLIPLTSYLLNNPLEEHQGSRILILTSRRERVNQINYTLKRIIKGFDLRIGFISGGRPYQHQMRLLKRPLDVLIATPGRLDDLVKNNKTDFSNLEALIIDDFSIIYHHGLQDLCKKIYEQATYVADKRRKPRQCPTLAFIQKEDESVDFIKQMLPDAAIVEVEEEKHPLVSVPQQVYIADDHTHKIALMDQMMDEFEDQSILIYTSNNKAASSLEDALSNHGHTAKLAHQISSDEKTSSENHPAIIISDQIDVDIATNTYKNIIHFDLPKKISVFQNRIVNKGWGELEKPAAILVGPPDRILLKKIESQVGDSIDQATLPGLEPMNAYISTPLLSLGNKKNSGKNNNNSGRGQNKRKPRSASRSGGNRNNNNSGAKNSNRQKQHKGPYGRLNGGIHRKRNKGGNQDFSPSRNSNPGNQKFAEGTDTFAKEIQKLEEKQSQKSKVVIQYKDRRRRPPSAATSGNGENSTDDQ